MPKGVIVGILPIMWLPLSKKMAVIVKERRPSCESQIGLLVQHLQPLDIVKEGGYNGGLLVAANNHCLMSKFGKFGNHHC
jgi:hypothetical protein